jgi:DNA-binding transcriptional LysR family regulator
MRVRHRSICTEPASDNWIRHHAHFAKLAPFNGKPARELATLRAAAAGQGVGLSPRVAPPQAVAPWPEWLLPKPDTDP